MKPDEPTPAPFSDRSFNPRSPDAMFATILERLHNQDGVLEEIRTGVQRTNGRVTALEREKWYQRGVVAAVSVAAAGLWEWLKPR